jgi:hypothetical protein
LLEILPLAGSTTEAGHHRLGRPLVPVQQQVTRFGVTVGAVLRVQLE